MNNSECYIYAIRLLAARDYSEYKLRKKLKTREYTENQIDEAIRSVIDKNYLNEKNYILLRIQGMIYKNLSQSYIKMSLQKEKLNVAKIRIEEIYKDMNQTEENQIENIISKKLPHIQRKTVKEKVKSKIIYYLASKGHSYSKISSILSSKFHI